MKTKRKKIEITRTGVANFRRSLIIGTVALLMGIFALPASAQSVTKQVAIQTCEHAK